MAAVAAVAVAAAACAGGEVVGDASRIDAAAVAELSDADRSTLAGQVNAFGLALQRQLVASEDGNVVTSPLSAHAALTLLAAGAQGETAEQLVEALGLEGPLDTGAGALLASLADADGVQLAISNAVFVDDGASLIDAYVAHVSSVLGATVETQDLGSDEGAAAVDAWVRDSTNDRIDGIAKALGLPSADVIAVLANAVWFLGDWTEPFPEREEHQRSFTLADGTVVETPTMWMQSGAMSADGDGWRALRLPYGEDERFAMHVWLPDADSSLSALLGELDAATLTEVIEEFEPPGGARRVQLPSFELSGTFGLVPTLQALGVVDVFVPGVADLSALSSAGPQLHIGEVVQKTWISVDEQGTEAAAATGMTAVVTSAPAGPVAEPFIVDRPFAFTIVDERTGAVLFMGTVEDPRG